MKKDNTTLILSRFIKKLRVDITRQSVREELQKHPDYGSLLAFSDVLNYWGVRNASYRVAFDSLIHVPVPFIASSNEEFVIVSMLNDVDAVIFNGGWNDKVLPISQFKALYSGSVLVAEKDEESGEADYVKKHRKEIVNDLRMPVFFFIFSLILIISILFYTPYVKVININIGFLTLIKTIGLLISILLLIQSVDNNNPFLQKLCGGDSGKDCNVLLTSKAAMVTDELSWSEVGFFYFAGTWLSLVFNSSHFPFLQVLALLNVISLPYTIYSLYYQLRIAKQWCVLCCTIQGVLWLEFYSFFPYISEKIHLTNYENWGSFLLCLFLPALIWIFIKPQFLCSKEIRLIQQQFREFKFNTDLFQKIFEKQILHILPTEENSLILGNSKAKQIITIVSNPYCEPCAITHKLLDEWIEKREDLKLQIIFFTEIDSMPSKVAAHLFRLKNSENEDLIKKALDDWYGITNMDYCVWAKKYPVKEFDIDNILKFQNDWCTTTKITHTPTIFINGRRLPDAYRTEDIKYFI